MGGQINHYEARSIDIDLIKIIAAFLVVLLHVSSMIAYDMQGIAWKKVVIINTLTRTAVPLFIMCSGAMLLGRVEPYQDFFKKRFIKVVIPLVSWSLFYEWHLINNGVTKTYFDVIKDFVTNNTMYHLWFLYVIASLYLITPILRKVVSCLTTKDYYYVLIVWLSFSLIDTLGAIFGFYKTPLLTFFSEYVCYFLIAYFLYKITYFSSKVTFLAWVMVIFGYGVSVIGTYYMTMKSGKYNEFFIGNGSFSIIITTLSTFILVSAYKKKIEGFFHNKVRKTTAITELSKLTFGIYLAHIYVLSLSYQYLYQSNFYNYQYPIIAVFVLTFVVFTVSGLITYILKKIPVLQYAV